MTAPHVGTRSGEGLLVVLLGGVAGVVLVVAMSVIGPGVALFPVGLALCWWLLWHPVATLGVLFTTTVCFEESKGIWPVAMDRWYAAIGGVVHAPDVLVLLLLGWTVIDGRDRRERRGTSAPGLGPFAPPLALLALATIGGVVTGYFAGGDVAVIYNSARVLVYVIAIPYATALVLSRRGDIRRAVQFAVAVVTGRALLGLVGWFAHGRGQGEAAGLRGVSASLNAAASSFYEPTMNFLMIVILLGVVAAVVLRQRLPRWLVLAAPLILLTVALSYRRSFWIAAALGLVLVLMVATGVRGRPWLVLGGAAVAIALYAAMFAGGSTDSTNPLLYRAQSLTPSKLVTTSGDRYRLDEQRNVIAEIKANPATGLGLGVPWHARFPVAENPPGGRLYTHVTPLWFWLKLGPFGFVAYAWLMVTAIRSGYRVWRRSADSTSRIAGLALAAGFVGLVVAELTGPFSGIDVRMTLVDGCVFGWLIAALAATAETGNLASSEERRPPLDQRPALLGGR